MANGRQKHTEKGGGKPRSYKRSVPTHPFRLDVVLYFEDPSIEETLGTFYKDQAGAQLDTKRTSGQQGTVSARCCPRYLHSYTDLCCFERVGEVIPAYTSFGSPGTKTTRPDTARRRKQGTDGVQCKIEAANGRVDAAHNADQTPVFFDYLPKSTITKKGAHTAGLAGGAGFPDHERNNNRQLQL
ncbi:hypothetical protein ON010_g7154 [Phytophthora cinnamomi]|nr:hypothetical protein ON010_g7154 [Phytophthora cinnamomi]